MQSENHSSDELDEFNICEGKCNRFAQMNKSFTIPFRDFGFSAVIAIQELYASSLSFLVSMSYSQ